MEFFESREWEWEFSRKNWELRMRKKVLREKWDWNWELDSRFSRIRVLLGLKVHLLCLFILKSLKLKLLKHQNCSEMLEKLPLKSTKFNPDVSIFWKFENERWDWEWEFSQRNWGSRLRMRREFSLRVSQKSAPNKIHSWVWVWRQSKLYYTLTEGKSDLWLLLNGLQIYTHNLHVCCRV